MLPPLHRMNWLPLALITPPKSHWRHNRTCEQYGHNIGEVPLPNVYLIQMRATALTGSRRLINVLELRTLWRQIAMLKRE